jgi:hypothetical protein
MKFEAGSPIHTGDVVVVGADGKAHADPRRHDWEPVRLCFRAVPKRLAEDSDPPYEVKNGWRCCACGCLMTARRSIGCKGQV